MGAVCVGLAFVAAWFSLENEPGVWIGFVLPMGLLAAIMNKG